MPDLKLNELKKDWYQKLKQDGFKDIESEKGHLRQKDNRTIAFKAQKQISLFFTKLTHYLTAHPEIPDQERQILELYCDGKFRTEIRRTLSLKNDHAVLKVIKKYRKFVYEIEIF